MKSNKTYLVSIVKHLVTLALLATIVVQPVVQCITLLTNGEFEIVQIDIEEDAEEKKHQKEYQKKDKKQLTTLITYHYTYPNTKTNSYTLLVPVASFNQEITIPPPDKV